jgi:hypothetical protein
MKRTIQTKVVEIENEGGEHPRVVLQCPEGELLEPKSSFKTKAIFIDQEPLVAASDRIKVLGKGKPSVNLGDTVVVEVVS